MPKFTWLAGEEDARRRIDSLFASIGDRVTERSPNWTKSDHRAQAGLSEGRARPELVPKAARDESSSRRGGAEIDAESTRRCEGSEAVVVGRRVGGD